jgi:hypothetical protein
MRAPVKTRIATLAALMLCITPLLGASRAGAIQSQLVCTPEQDPSQRFCVSYDAQVGPTLNARDPFDLDVSITNASTASQTDTSKWMDSVTVHMLGTTVSTPEITQSRDLPNQLVIAGDDTGSCTQPTFTDCDAGHGTFVFDVSGSPGGIVDGVYSGHFGITRVVNVNVANAPPAAGTYSYLVDFDICVPVLIGSCTIHVTPMVPVTGSVAAAQGSGSVDLSLPLWQSGDQQVPCGITTCNIHYEGTLDSGALHLDGTSNTLQGGGAAGGPFTIFTLPFTCGSASGSATFTTHNSPRSVTVTQPPVTLTGCPTASFTATPSTTVLAASKLDGSASAATVQGRTIARYRWTFGDGKSASTTGAVTAHQYAAAPESPSTYLATLVAVDSAGAVSTPVSHSVPGTATALFVVKLSATKMEAVGNVLPRHGGKIVTVTLFRKQGTSFVNVQSHTPTLDSRSRYAVVFTRPAATTCKIVTRFPNDADHLGSQAVELTHC